MNSRNLKLGLIGVGTVGHAVSHVFKHFGYKVFEYDKYKKIGSFEDTLESDILFLCLPTLYKEELNEYDKSAIEETLEKLNENNYKGIVVLKSTVEPGYTQKISEKWEKLTLFHNPEFLTARINVYDFFFQDQIVIGKTKNCSQESVDTLHEFFRINWQSSKLSVCTSTESELMKISCNNYYCVKVQFFNELYLLCKNLDTDYQKVRDLMLSNNKITSSHTQVPGHDGQLSYGGMCFPKDSNALYQFMKKNKVPCKVLEATILERNEMRND